MGTPDTVLFLIQSGTALGALMSLPGDKSPSALTVTVTVFSVVPKPLFREESPLHVDPSGGLEPPPLDRLQGRNKSEIFLLGASTKSHVKK